MRIMLTLSRAEYEDLLKTARTERRRPQDQAAHLLEQALKAHAPESPRPIDPEPVAA